MYIHIYIYIYIRYNSSTTPRRRDTCRATVVAVLPCGCAFDHFHVNVHGFMLHVHVMFPQEIGHF